MNNGIRGRLGRMSSGSSPSLPYIQVNDSFVSFLEKGSSQTMGWFKDAAQKLLFLHFVKNRVTIRNEVCPCLGYSFLDSH